MSSVAHAISLQGIEGVPVAVEAHVGSGMVTTTIVGMGDTAVRESKERLRAALSSCLVAPLGRRLTVNLSPASLPKNGSGFDLAIAVAVLIARGLLVPSVAAGTVFVAELGLDGSLRDPQGMLALILAAKRNGFTRVVVPDTASHMAERIAGIRVIPCRHLRQLLDVFGTDRGPVHVDQADGWDRLERDYINPPDSGLEAEAPASALGGETRTETEDLVDLRGQDEARFALLVAAVGGHHLLFFGDPGSGKTMLAERLQGILPPLSPEQRLTVAATYSAVGATRREVEDRPPAIVLGPTTTVSSLLGGGGRQARPGALSLADQGVLVLNEAPGFAPTLLDALRQPLEAGIVTIRRAAGMVQFPARFQLVLTANPCPCGLEGTPGACSCHPMQKLRYRQRLSGPLLDRIDIHQEVLQPSLEALTKGTPMTSSAARELVTEARLRSASRWAGQPWSTNAGAPGSFLRNHSTTPRSVMKLLDHRIDRGKLSLRGADRILRVAWSIADLAARNCPETEDFAKAEDLRTTNTWRQQ